jgi:hypothetical protein
MRTTDHNFLRLGGLAVRLAGTLTVRSLPDCWAQVLQLSHQMDRLKNITASDKPAYAGASDVKSTPRWKKDIIGLNQVVFGSYPAAGPSTALANYLF